VSIAKGETLEARYKDHELKGEWKGYRECHIRPDVLLVYQIQDDVLILLLVDIGSHAQLFE
jgi:mRNA interferase YafQ